MTPACTQRTHPCNDWTAFLRWAVAQVLNLRWLRASAIATERGGAWAVQDNYAWLLREGSGKVAVVDPSEAAPVVQALESR